MANAIEFNHVSKLYRLGYVSTGALKDDFHRFWVTKILKREDPYLKVGVTNDRTTKGDSNYVWALRDIDFKVAQGDVVGIIGKNGAGKSTLLKLLSRVTGPTTGNIRAHGRIGSLLEVGTGFHGEMTGRENIFMNGAILGMSHNEIAAKLDEIIAFSGCERYIDTPVKRYSSGMTVRLGFAVAAHLEPEILVVDEVLAVGDAEFQKKAIGKMQNVAGDGRTVLFVSHNMTSIKQLCHSGVVLENGQVSFKGTAEQAIERYLAVNLDNIDAPLAERTDRQGNGRIRFTNVVLSNISGVAVTEAFVGQYIKIEAHFVVNDPTVIPENLIFAMSLNDGYNATVVNWVSDEMQLDFTNAIKRGYIALEIPALYVRPNTYNLGLQISENSTSPQDFCDLISPAIQLTVLNDDLLTKGRNLKDYRGYSAIVPAMFV